VCDHERIFTHCYVGHVGSVHDARVFGLSSLANFIEDDAKFPGNTHLLGDGAHSLHKRVMTPYQDNGQLNPRQRNYNFMHSSPRMAIERAFGLLKGRWRSLLSLLAMDRVERIPHHIMARCVLHNICLLRRDDLQALAVGGNDNDGNDNDGKDNPMPGYGGPVHVVNDNRQFALAKRDFIAADLPMHVREERPLIFLKNVGV